MVAPSPEAVPPFYRHAPPGGATSFEAGVPAYTHAQPAGVPAYTHAQPAGMPAYTHDQPAGAAACKAELPVYAHAQPAVAPAYQVGVPGYAHTKADGAPTGEGEVPAYAQAQPAGAPGQPVIIVQQTVSTPPASQQQNVNVSVSQVQASEVPVLYFIGLGWLLFILGFPTLGITWIVGAFMLFCVRDDRDRPGFIACAVATVILVIIVIASAASNR